MDDRIVARDSQEDGSPRESRSTSGSVYAPTTMSTSNFQVYSRLQQSAYYRSRRVPKGEAEKPWKKLKKDPREKWVTWIPLIFMGLGVVVAAYIIYSYMAEIMTKQTFCPVLDEDFSGGLNSAVWTKEVEVGGFGNGQFEETTNSGENAFIKNGQLWIQPTLQDEALMNKNNVLNLLGKGCTGSDWFNCVAATNVTNGTVINPVKSARLNTKKGATIRYGRVEVVAQLPAGDWLWPAIWMLPVNALYGPWPASGEIDIAESRGNNYTYPYGGNQMYSSALHYGPEPHLDSWWQQFVQRPALHTTFSKGFHTFGLEWTPKYLFTYLDKKPFQVLYTKFAGQTFWQRGGYPPSDSNGTKLVDPWSQTGRLSTPFDQDFYLILNVAVGSTNGWFKDGLAGKPWIDASPTAKRDFWNARSQWYPTWKDNGQMIIKSVKMWQLGGYRGCGD